MRDGAHETIGSGVGPRPRNQLDRIEACADQQIRAPTMSRSIAPFVNTPANHGCDRASRPSPCRSPEPGCLCARTAGGSPPPPRASVRRARPAAPAAASTPALPRTRHRARPRRRTRARSIFGALCRRASSRARTSPRHSIWTGPRGGDRAISSASPTTSDAFSGVMRNRRLRDRRKQRALIDPLVFARGEAPWLSVKTSSGARSRHAHATPFTTDAAPGPSVVRHTPARPMTSAWAIAAIARAGLGRRQHERHRPRDRPRRSNRGCCRRPGTPKSMRTPRVAQPCRRSSRRRVDMTAHHGTPSMMSMK